MLAEAWFRVFVDDGFVFRFGVTRASLLDNVVYLLLEPVRPFPQLTVTQWKALRERFDEVMVGFRPYAQVAKQDNVSARFLRFFGFKETASGMDRIQYEKDWDK